MEPDWCANNFLLYSCGFVLDKLKTGAAGIFLNPYHQRTYDKTFFYVF